MSDPVRIVSWNIRRSAAAWRLLAQAGVDVALVQEAQAPPADLLDGIQIDAAPWVTGGAPGRNWRSAVAGLSQRVDVQAWPLAPLDSVDEGGLRVSLPGTLAVADVIVLGTGETITVASVHGVGESTTGSASWVYADASVHRLLSDLSVLIGYQGPHRLIVAGDLNVLRGYGEVGSPYWGARYATVFSRMEALGLSFVGPEAPGGGCQPEPWPAELPSDSLCVPTYRAKIDQPETATRQLDFVFASPSLDSRLQVIALNSPEEWGPSDHCRICIELQL